MTSETVAHPHELARDDALRAVMASGIFAALRPWSEYPSPMHFAANIGNAEGILALAAAGAPVDLSDDFGMTPLHYAALQDDPAALAALLGLGANPLFRRGFRFSALMWAASNGGAEVIRMLAPLSDLDAADSEGRRASDLARHRLPQAAAQLDAEALSRNERQAIAEIAAPPPSAPFAKSL